MPSQLITQNHKDHTVKHARAFSQKKRRKRHGGKELLGFDAFLRQGRFFLIIDAECLPLPDGRQDPAFDIPKGNRILQDAYECLRPSRAVL